MSTPKIDAEAFAPYRESGWQAIPLHRFDAESTDRGGRTRRDGKRPVHANWTARPYSAAKVISCSVAEGRNVGVRLAPDQLVIDVDPRNGGTEGFAALCTALALDPTIFPTVITGSGGAHYYMRKPADLSVLDTLPDFPGVEFKSKGRQVVAAGSIHPDTLKHYAWDFLTPPLADAPEAPAALLQAIRRPERTGNTIGGGQYSQERIAAALARLDPENFRNHSKWLALMMAVHHATNGDGRQEFIDWSTSDPQYADDADVIGRRWDSLHADAAAGRITHRTLAKILAENGATDAILADPAERAADFEAMGEEAAEDMTFEGDDEEPSTGLTYEIAAGIEAEPIEWLWQNRFPVGKLSMIAGFPDQGKSQVTLNIAATVSRGGKWPNGEGKARKGAVLILSAEDDAADTVVPRLSAGGADLDQCLIVNSMVRIENSARVLNLQDDLGKLAEIIRKERGNGRDVRLVLIDPIGSYMGGRSKGDSFKNAEVRALLTPLAEWAARLRVAVIAVSHFNKSGNGRAIYRVTDSLAFTAAARTVWLTAEDPEDPKRRLLLKGKCNIADDPGGLAYKIEGVNITPEITAPRVVWDGTTDITAEEALGQSGERKPTAAERAGDFLARLLSDGPVLASRIQELAEEAGYSWRTITRTKAELGIVSEKDGFDAGWQWRLPEAEDFEEDV